MCLIELLHSFRHTDQEIFQHIIDIKFIQVLSFMPQYPILFFTFTRLLITIKSIITVRSIYTSKLILSVY